MNAKTASSKLLSQMPCGFFTLYRWIMSGLRLWSKAKEYSKLSNPIGRGPPQKRMQRVFLWAQAQRMGKWNGPNVAPLSHQISSVPIQEDTPPILRSRLTCLKVMSITGYFGHRPPM